MYKNCTRYATLLLLFNLIFSNLSAQDGTPDASFGNNGRVFNPELGIVGSAGVSLPEIFTLPDGKLLYLTSFNGAMVLIRYMPNGQPDPSFGSGGKLVTQTDIGFLVDAVMQPDGKIVFFTNKLIGRTNQNGTLDPSFGQSGKVIQRVVASGLALQSDGKILISGNNFGASFRWGVERYQANGSKDLTWDGDGLAEFDMGYKGGNAFSLLVQQDGKVLVGGHAVVWNPSSRKDEAAASAARLHTNGSLDESFDGDGKMFLHNSQFDFHNGRLAFQPGGKILLAGTSVEGSFGFQAMAVYRFLLNGTLDAGFGSGGVSNISFTGKDELKSLNVQADGKILLSGHDLCFSSSCDLTTRNNFIVARLLASGSPDPSWNGNGKLSLDVSRSAEGLGSVIGFGTQLILAGRSVTETGGSIRASMIKLHNSSTLLSSMPSTMETYAMIPGKIEAEHWTTMSGVQTEVTSDAGGGLNVGWIDYGDYIDYNIEVTTAGYYRVETRVASPNPNALFASGKYSENNFSTNFKDVPNTGSYQSWTTVSQMIALQPGKQTFRIKSYGGAFNINWINFTQVPFLVNIPAKIEAEHYSNSFGIQTEETSDAGGGMNVGWIDHGDMIGYGINVPQSGTYNISFRLATPNPNANFIYFINNFQNTKRYNLSPTGGWQNWTTVTIPYYLEAGPQWFTIVSQGGGGFNVNWIEFSLPQMTTKALPGASAGEEQIAKAGIYPNPVQDQFTLALDNPHTGNFKAQVINSAGMVYKEFNLNKPQGTYQARLSVAGLPAGEYFLRLSGKGWTNTQKIIKR
jgi:uncharacterized delta-60 repeat protein